MKKKFTIIILLTLFTMISSCDKYLEEKSDKRLATPTTIADLKALLFHNNMFLSFSSAAQLSSDDLVISDKDFNGLSYDSDKRLYSWKPDYVSKAVGSVGNNWQKCYAPIFVCNSVLQSLSENKLSGIEADEVKGQALVLRSARFLDGAQVWAPIFNVLTANEDLGMVLRLDPDMNLKSIRASVQQTYDQIINDLSDAVPLLPANSTFPGIPTKGSAYGLLARTYLIIGNYELARENAENALQQKNKLIDFNLLKSTDAFPVAGTQIYKPDEILFFSTMTINDIDINSAIKVNPELYDLYKDGDLRKVMYYKQGNGGFVFKGSQSRAGLFNGPTTAEMLLIISECYARDNKVLEAKQALDQLRIKRWKSEKYKVSNFVIKEEAMKAIFEERRRELAFRSIRWSDLKRLNRDGANILLSRINNGETITLSPNDKRYAIALPEDVISIAQIPQNPR
ncbi:RagB/SusD family nutrient uptake outer membrane protein [Sphingobacterium faecium]|uniref:RagB/SusD family nutrient uptake outer membrane protein n=1 Tax=Sphingobacterium faecium TaxID=34087 RepID=UPI0032079AF9